MGLAPYGEPRYKHLILSELMDLKEDGSFKLNMKYFDFGSGLRMINKKFERFFGGPARRPESKLTQRDMDLARSIQEVTEEVMLRMARHVHQMTGQKNLCLAGGVALNCVGNGRILREGPFERLWVQPAAGDAGGAVGAAYFAWHQYLENPRHADEEKDSMKGAFLGPEFSNEDIHEFLERENIPFVELSEDEITRRIADLIAEEKVVGWFQGRMEFGPRALGGRSILGDPRSPKMQEMMNLKIKFRESFRPFAPSVLEEKISDYFEMSCESPYMLLVAPVQSHKRLELSGEAASRTGLELLNTPRSTIPAVTHVDYSARIQTVNRENHPLYYELLETLDKKYGCPLVINTSFNVRGEPIVCTPEDAYRCFMRTNMDYLILGPYLLEKKGQRPLDKDIDWLREFELD
jgi:carbamoyltransferase